MKNQLIFITGGARSGKTSYAEREARKVCDKPVYVATAPYIPADKEFQKRIERHIADRGEHWHTIEERFYVSKLTLEGKVVLIDCVTLWLSNFFSLHGYDVDKCLSAIKNEVDEIKKINAHFFVVSNEIGMGVHASTEIGRKFTDLQGWTNQYLASRADEVVFMVSGIPLIIKSEVKKKLHSALRTPHSHR